MRDWCVLAAALLLLVPLRAEDAQAPGVPNFHRVNERVYRGGQPAGEGWHSLARLGVRTVIDLRRESAHSAAAERRVVEAAGMRYVNEPMNGIVAPRPEQIARILALLESSAATPVFVHCRRGRDRTGAVIACYRIAHDRWPNEKALKEAKAHGMSWIEFGMKRYVRRFQAAGRPAPAEQDLDAAAGRR
jgi:tyrosine-protein phosphatase SIW14